MKMFFRSGAGLLTLMLVAFSGLLGYAQQGPRYLASTATVRPASVLMAEEPNAGGGGEAYQGHSGPSFRAGSASALNDTGSERIPDYPAGAEPNIVTVGPGVIMPNGGETIWQSTNAMPK